VFDTGATIKIATLNWARRFGLRVTNRLVPPMRVGIGNGFVYTHMAVNLTVSFYNKEGELKTWILSNVHLTDSGHDQLLLIGGDMVRNSEYDVVLHMKSGTVQFNNEKESIQFETTRGDSNCILMHPLIQANRLDPLIGRVLLAHPKLLERKNGKLTCMKIIIATTAKAYIGHLLREEGSGTRYQRSMKELMSHVNTATGDDAEEEVKETKTLESSPSEDTDLKLKRMQAVTAKTLVEVIHRTTNHKRFFTLEEFHNIVMEVHKQLGYAGVQITTRKLQTTCETK
jgi:hypothetical protein